GQALSPFLLALLLAIWLVPQTQVPGQGESLVAGAGDSLAIGAHVVLFSRSVLRPAFLPAALGWLHLALPSQPLLDAERFANVPGSDQVSLDIWLEVVPDDFLPLRSNGDNAVVPTMSGLMRFGAIEPDRAGHVDVNAAHDDHFAEAHASE